MLRRALSLALSCVFALACALPALAQEQDSRPVYWRVALWDVKREMWPDFLKLVEKYDQPVYEKLFKDGVITEWGVESAGLHNPEEYTHATWEGVASRAALEKVDEAFEAAEKAMGDQESAGYRKALAGMLVKHRDFLIRVDDIKAKESRLDRAYYSEWSVAVKAGEGRNFASWWREHSQPVYEKLLGEGVILAYGRTREEIRTEPENRQGGWYVTADLAGVDKVKAAFATVRDGMSEEQRRARWSSIREIVEPNSFREYVSRYHHWAIKAR